MEELQEKLTHLTSDKDVRYFYHITPESGDKILEEGLIVASKFWEDSFLEFTDTELHNIESVIKENAPNKLKDSHTIILAGVYKDSIFEDGFVRKLQEEETYGVVWEGVGTPDYIVDSEHLIGYIDLDTLELIINERANVCGDYFDL